MKLFEIVKPSILASENRKIFKLIDHYTITPQTRIQNGARFWFGWKFCPIHFNTRNCFLWFILIPHSLVIRKSLSIIINNNIIARSHEAHLCQEGPDDEIPLMCSSPTRSKEHSRWIVATHKRKLFEPIALGAVRCKDDVRQKYIPIGSPDTLSIITSPPASTILRYCGTHFPIPQYHLRPDKSHHRGRHQKRFTAWSTRTLHLKCMTVFRHSSGICEMSSKTLCNNCTTVSLFLLEWPPLKHSLLGGQWVPEETMELVPYATKISRKKE